jgi:hypothetical protein
MRKYSDFFTVYEEYCPIMTREEINKTLDHWLNFYPHPDFEEICKTLFSVLEAGPKSVWITGNLGTGKSNATLVIQKLFMDDDVRVRQWLDEHANGLSDKSSLEESLFSRRSEGTLVIYDYNSSNVGPDVDLLVRLQQGIIAALNDYGLEVPAMSMLDVAIDRIKREGENFFKARNTIQSQLRYLNANIKNVDQLENALYYAADSPKLLSDVERVFRADNIYLPFDVAKFREWIKEILRINNYKSIVYLFDEFHPFIEANKEELKTFEDVTETPGVNRFFLIPVTHMDISAYLAEGSQRYKYAHDRFYFRKLQMPNDTAFRLARHAMKDVREPTERIAEWKKAKDDLWDSISPIVSKFSGTDDPARASFYEILPIHPMAAFLLKHLSEQAKSNQRSFFEYLKGGADGKEFQEFIDAGGPEVASKQLLTVDYLWNFFVGNRKDSGLDNEIVNIGAFYKQTHDRAFQNQVENAPELRVLKAILLFCLLDKLAPGGHDRLKPTVENIELSFKGDGTIADTVGIIEALEKKHCFTVTNGNISLFTISSVKPEDVEKFRDSFHELLHEKVQGELEEHTKNYRRNSSGRFDVRVSDVAHTTLTNITQATRDKYTADINKDDGSVCLWFVVAKDHGEQIKIPQQITRILEQLNDHRILMFTFPQLSFCHSNKNIWNEYIRQYAQYMNENYSAAKKQIRDTLDGIEEGWFKELRKNDTLIRVYRYNNDQVDISDVSWSAFKELITKYVRRTLNYNIDHLGFQDPHFNNSSLQSYAKAGITFTGSAGPITNLINTLKKGGVSDDDNWFSNNPDHPLTAIHSLFERKFSNTVGRGGQQSLRVVYIELKRAPYGLRYNALSAFALGFCLRDILQKNYQWTNGQLTFPLDIDALAEIIETVVKDDGNNKIGSKEKFICRLSKEEKKFIDNAPLMFGISPIADATVESVLKQISARVETESSKVPLWVLTEYIRSTNDPKAGDIEAILNNVCTALTISNKGRVEERVNAVKKVGEIIIRDPDIVEAIANHVRRDSFVKAFDIYVDQANPKLMNLANSIGDVSHGYCRSILDRCQQTAGWLWSQADISREIQDVMCEYEIISLAKALCGFGNFAPYKNVYNALKCAVTETNRLPKQIIESFYPALVNFLSALHTTGNSQEIKLALQQNYSLIESLFFDPSITESLSMLRLKSSDITIDDSALRDIFNDMVGGFGLDENTFLDNIRIKIEEYAKKSVVHKIKHEWSRISQSSSPAEWAINNKLPAKYIFGNHPDTLDMLRAVELPEVFAAAKLTDILEVLSSMKPASISDCQKALMADVIPMQYIKFDISIASLIDFLCRNYSNQPNNWPPRPDVTAFIKKQYKGAIAPQIKENIRARRAEDLKQQILELTDDYPELGLLFMED